MRIGSYFRDSVQRIAEPRAWTRAMQVVPDLSSVSAQGPGSGALEARTTLGRVLSDGTAASSLYVATQGVAE